MINADLILSLSSAHHYHCRYPRYDNFKSFSVAAAAAFEKVVAVVIIALGNISGVIDKFWWIVIGSGCRSAGGGRDFHVGTGNNEIRNQYEDM